MDSSDGSTIKMDDEGIFEPPERSGGRFALWGGLGIGIVVVVCVCLVGAGVIIASGIGYIGPGDFFDTTGGGSIQVGEPASGTIVSNTEAHNWFFEGAEGQVVEVFVTGDGISDPRARLIDPNNKVVARNDDTGDSFDAYILATLSSTGTYTIRVDMFEPGDYTISLN